jgi:hypothetical protein
MTAVRSLRCGLLSLALVAAFVTSASAGIFVGVGPVAAGIGHGYGYPGYHGQVPYPYGYGYGRSYGCATCYAPLDPAPVYHGHFRPYLTPEYGYYGPAAPYWAPYAGYGQGVPYGAGYGGPGYGGCDTCGY